jgi:hypothetical protein
MKVKVKYEETVAREATIDVDEAEFVDWMNNSADNDPPYETMAEIIAEDPGWPAQLKEFLDDGDESEWAQAITHDPMAEAYDRRLLDVELP